MNSGDAAKYGIDPTALNTLQGIGQDLQRATTSDSVKTGGSDTAYNLAANGWLARNLYGPNFQGTTGLGKTIGGLGAMALGHPMVGLGILSGAQNKLGQTVGARLQGPLNDMMLNPQSLLPYLDAQSAGAARPVSNGLLQYLGGGALQRAPLVVQGLMSPQPQQPPQQVPLTPTIHRLLGSSSPMAQ
jgi:hypothetical protein